MATMLDRDIHLSSALVIDGNATSRSILVSQLRDFGFGSVAQCGRIAEARQQLEAHRFDVVLCEQGANGGEGSGQQLLDELRRQQMLPLATVFIMLTVEATYAMVAEAAESALDSYLVKPHTAAALGERLAQARRRKKVLHDIFSAIEQNRIDDAAALCSKRFGERAEFWLFAARLGAELLLGRGRAREAGALYAAVLKLQPAPWARLGVARAQAEGNELATAAATLDSLLAEQPGFVDAYDVAGRVQLDLGNFDAALSAYRHAATLTPGSVARLQKAGMLAYHMGAQDEAAQTLERAAATGSSSKSFDHQTLVVLAFIRFAARDAKGVQRCADELEFTSTRLADDTRLARFALVTRVLAHVLREHSAKAMSLLEQLAAETRAESFDIEAAANLLGLLSLLAAHGAALPASSNETVDAIGLRHCASKSLTELLLRAAAAHAPFVERIKVCHQRVLEVTEKALAHNLAGDPAAAVASLMGDGKAALNGKLIDNAGQLLRRHQDHIPDAARLLAEVQDLRSRYACVSGRVTMGDSSGRKAGALALRAPARAAAPALGA